MTAKDDLVARATEYLSSKKLKTVADQQLIRDLIEQIQAPSAEPTKVRDEKWVGGPVDPQVEVRLTNQGAVYLCAATTMTHDGALALAHKLRELVIEARRQ